VPHGPPQRVEEGAGDGPGRGDRRRLAEGAHALLAAGPEDGLDVRHVGGAGDAVPLEVRVDHRADVAVQDPLLEEREADALDDGADDLALGGLAADRRAARLDRDDAPYVAIVNEAMAERFWPGEDAVGRMLRRPDGNDIRVIGVAETAKIRTLGEAPRPFIYLSYSQSYASFMTVVARTSLDAEATVMRVLAAAREVDPELWIWEAKTMDHHLAIPLLPARLSALILSAFGVLALTLSSVGLYGVVSYAVSQRTRKMGIRLALGADARAVVRMLTGSGLRLVVAGAAIGLVLALLLTRALSSLLFGVGAFDAVTFIAVPTLLGGIALLAAYLPARRASRIDPVKALRVD